jgi:hypothetical protein
MELTPELFETTEFAERRKGYDIEQVETFLEETGTALAQLLARTRHTEERTAHAEARLAQADAAIAEAQQRMQAAEQRADSAERAAREAVDGAASAAAATARMHEEAEVEQAAKTLLMAKRTADATVNEARGQAQALLEDSQNRAQRQLAEANAEAAELIRRANEEAEAEFAARRAGVLDEVQRLEEHRSQLADAIVQLESRLAGYRDELGRAAQELVALAEDPLRLGARPTIAVVPDEVLAYESPLVAAARVDVATNEPTPTEAAAGAEVDEPDAVAQDPAPAGADVDPADAHDPCATGPVEVPSNPGAESMGAESSAQVGGSATAVLTESSPVAVGHEGDSHYVDLTTPAQSSVDAGTDDRWGPGSWAEVEGDLIQDAEEVRDTAADAQLDRPTEAVGRAEMPRDRYMEELDSAVNEAVSIDEDDAAMTAFFEGSSDSRSRRFGWRR